MVILTFPNNSRSSCNNPPSAKKGAFGGLRQGRSRNSSFARSMWSDSLATSPEERSVASSLTSRVSENLGVYLGGKNW